MYIQILTPHQRILKKPKPLMNEPEKQNNLLSFLLQLILAFVSWQRQEAAILTKIYLKQSALGTSVTAPVPNAILGQ